MRIAHLSDPHLGPLPRPPLAALLSKRAFGYANWVKNRRAALNPRILDALLEDLHDHEPDHICVTGDLVNIAMPHEYDTAAAFLTTLGQPDDVSCVPGNHDAYVPGGAGMAAKAWALNMSGDDGLQRFPYLRRRGGIAIIGVSTAVATVPLSARGRVGQAQCEALRTALDRADDAYKIGLIHHPPDRALASGHRGLV
ncbi:MAG: metallophosphoesterase, partial [Pseudomonadota bacterium]